MYICIYVYMYICIYVYMYICIYVYMYICIYVYMYICIYVYMYICTCKYMKICLYMYTCMYKRGAPGFEGFSVICGLRGQSFAHSRLLEGLLEFSAHGCAQAEPQMS